MGLTQRLILADGAVGTLGPVLLCFGMIDGWPDAGLAHEDHGNAIEATVEDRGDPLPCSQLIPVTLRFARMKNTARGLLPSPSSTCPPRSSSEPSSVSGLSVAARPPPLCDRS